ncbi:MAG: DddA-like double-stranded DNA deaminase toxin [Stackebrandtia sp.]
MSKVDLIRPLLGRKKTVGHAYDTVTGEQVGDGEIWSVREGPGRGGSGLAAPWRQMESLTEHTEGHAAAIMRAQGPRDVTLYINREPCPGPDGCRERLNEALPQGDRMTVFVVRPGGAVRRRKFEGTGEGLEQKR